jgi:hypothetical protein
VFDLQVGELTRSHVTAAAPMVSPPATAATAATTSGAVAGFFRSTGRWKNQGKTWKKRGKNRGTWGNQGKTVME